MRKIKITPILMFSPLAILYLLYKTYKFTTPIFTVIILPCLILMLLFLLACDRIVIKWFKLSAIWITEIIIIII